MRGRPLRFLTMLVAGWLAARAALLWPDPPRPPAAHDDFVPYAVTRLEPAPLRPSGNDGFLPYAIAREFVVPPIASERMTDVYRAEPRLVAFKAPGLLSDARILALFGMRHYIEVAAPPASYFGHAPPSDLPTIPTTVAPLPRTLPSRWRLSSWLIARPGGGDPRLVPLLGGSQAGARVSYAPDANSGVAVFARAATPLSAQGAEGAIGVEFRASSVPVAGYVEVRQRDGLHGAVAAGLYGGVLKDVGRFRLDGYGQAGVIASRTTTGFAEGQVRATRRISPDLDAGIGVWGAAQAGATRFDVGPTLGVALPLKHGGARVTLDWRQRIAGAAQPGSGFALSLGADF